MLLLSQQGRDGGAGLIGRGYAPSGGGQPPRGHGIGRIDAEAFGSELAGKGNGLLPDCGIALADSHEGDNDGDRSQQGHHRYRPFGEVHCTPVLAQMLSDELVQALVPEGGCHGSNIIGRQYRPSAIEPHLT